MTRVINICDEIFTKIEVTKEWLIDNEIIFENIICQKCGNTAKLQRTSSYEKDIIQWRCKQLGCQKRKRLSKSKIALPKLIHCVYLLMLEVNYRNMYIYHGISDCTIASIKSKLISIYKIYLDQRQVFLGGPGVIVEVDESVLSRRGIIRSPTSFDENRNDTVWILGGVEKNNPSIFFLKRVPNRRIDSLSMAMEGTILLGSTVFSDGYPSYPGVCENLYFNHHVVNHNHGFVASDGTHTNSIEGFWSHLKSSMRKENGVKRDKIDDWLIQYTFKRRFIMNCNREEFTTLFIEVLKLYFNE